MSYFLNRFLSAIENGIKIRGARSFIGLTASNHEIIIFYFQCLASLNMVLHFSYVSYVTYRTLIHRCRCDCCYFHCNKLMFSLFILCHIFTQLNKRVQARNTDKVLAATIRLKMITWQSVYGRWIQEREEKRQK